MKIILKLSSGKKVNLTKEEFDELRTSFQEAIAPYWANPNPWDIVRTTHPNPMGPTVIYSTDGTGPDE